MPLGLENYRIPRANLINFQSEEFDHFFSLLGEISDESGLS